MPKEMTAGELAERSLITKYRKTIWNRFIGGARTMSSSSRATVLPSASAGARTV